jgi:1-deoxy-D-xylulose-5-phosphate reductoisomerase
MVQYSSKQIMYVSKPNMQIPIKEALLGFSQVSPNVQDFNKSYLLTKIDEKKWLPIQWAYQILKSPRSSLPIVINAANEVAIQSFMNKQIKFNEITTTIERTIKHFKPQIVTNIKQVYTIDQAVRKYLKN